VVGDLFRGFTGAKLVEASAQFSTYTAPRVARAPSSSP
jgi:hypothetical protein